MMSRLWGSDWSWSSLELASSGESDAKVSVDVREGSKQGAMELDLEAAESAPLLPTSLRIATQGPLTSDEPSTSGAQSAFAAFASRPHHDRPPSCLREHSGHGHGFDSLKSKFSKKSVAWAEPSASSGDDEEVAPRTYRGLRSASTDSGGMGARKSSLHHIEDVAPFREEPTFCARIKAAGLALRHLGREVLSLYHALHDPRTPRMARFLPWLIVMFARSPLSPIPDCLPVLNVLNNLLLMPGLIWLAIRSVPAQIMDEARKRAASGPVLLSRSWLTPVLIFLVWLLGLEACLYAIIRTWGSTTVIDNVWIILPSVAGLASTGFVLWLLSLEGDWELMLMYGVEYKEMSTLHWLEDAAPQVSHKRRAGRVYEGGPVTP